jgi:C4-dicarboxylate transporter DctM subunit
VAPREPGPRSLGEVASALADVLPFGFIIVGTLGGLYLGYVTTTEAAVIGCLLATVFGAVWGNLTVRGFVVATFNTVRFTGNILFLILAAFVFSAAIGFAGINQRLVEFVVSLQLSRGEFFVALFVIYLILGCFIESLGMIVITLPLIFPLLANYGIDPILFGVVLVMFAEIAQITPPLGINLFVIQSIWKGRLRDVVIGAVPFELVLFLILVMIILWPDLVLWLPTRMSN